MLDLETITNNVVDELCKARNNAPQDVFTIGNNTIFKLVEDTNYVVVSENDVFGKSMVAARGHEHDTVNELKKFLKKGDTYVEVGANYGDFLLALSDYVGKEGKAYGFEPSLSVFPYLQASVFLNGKKNVVLENKIVSDHQGSETFLIRDETDPCGSLGSSVLPVYETNTFEGLAVDMPSVRLDNYFSDANKTISMVRIDAEGSECRVIRGLENTIASADNMVISLEWTTSLLSHFETNESLEACINSLQTGDYKIYLLGDYNKELSQDDIFDLGHVELLATKSDLSVLDL
jgi:FkbM family methyltransferase